MKSNYKITMTAAATLIALGSFASVHAGTVTWDNNGGAGDNEWGTATNWDPATPTAGDTVIINNGDTVNIDGNALNISGAGLDVRVSGSDLTFTGVPGAFQFNMNGATISLDATSSFSGGTNYIRLYGAGFVFEDGATANMRDMEINGVGGSLTFGLEGAGSFTTIVGFKNLHFSGGGGVETAIDNTAFVVDFDGYTGGAQTFDLIDWNDGSATGLTEAIFNTANFSFLNGTGYEASTFNWNDTTNTVSLTVAVPEPSSAAALLGLVAVFAMVQRRKRS
jgi:hypothetical protein